MAPVEALTRYSISEGEKGPPWGPENAMLVEGVTINDGGDCPAGAPICVNKSVAGMASNAIEAIWPLATPSLNILFFRFGRTVRARLPLA
jgi:hypothetical protein